MVMQSLRSGAAGGFLKYMLFGILGMSVGGLVLMDVRGVLGGSAAGGSDVAKIDNHTISIRQFDRALRLNLSRYNMTPQQAYKMGLVNEILSNEIRSYLILNNAESFGIDFDEAAIAERISEIVKPHQQNGQSLQETLNQLLRAQGIVEKDFISSIKREMARDVIMGAIQEGFVVQNDDMARDLYAFQKQTRDVQLIIFPNSEVKIAEPIKPEQLEHVYDITKDQKYKIPEYRSVNVASLDPNDIKFNISVTDEEIEAAYTENIENFAVGEQMLLTQALLESQEQADKIYAQVKEGKDLKLAVTNVMGDAKRYYENIPFETDVMLPALSAVLSDREIGTVHEPVQTTLGYHIVRLEKIIPPSTKPLEAVRSGLALELTEVKKTDALFELSNKIDGMFEDGASFEDVQKTVPELKISVVELMDASGAGKDGKNSIEEFGEQDAPVVTESVFELKQEDSPVLQELPSGIFTAFAITKIEPESYKPFDAVKDELSAQVLADMQRADNKEKVQKLVAEIGTAGSSFEDIAKAQGKSIQTISKIGVGSDMPAPLLPDSQPVIFKTVLGGSEFLELDGGFALMKISGYGLPKKDDAAAENDLTSIKDALEQQGKDDAFLTYLNGLNAKYKASVNQALLDKAYGAEDTAEGN